uniref:Uncharacterized protein n=1 Tax=Ditylenchus dipsaci TaxID=166011 RepID=A0A915D6R8_9BILA
MTKRTEQEVDLDYLKSLEQKLKSLKQPNNSRALLDDLAKVKEQQLADLITGKDCAFQDDFFTVSDTPLQPNWIQRKVAPETVALTKEELAKLQRTGTTTNTMTDWELIEFTPVPFCNTYSLHILPKTNLSDIDITTSAVDINGHIHWLDKAICTDLKEHLEEDSNHENFSLELVASDTSLFAFDKYKFGYLATCWVVYDRLFAPARYFAVFFRFSNDLKVEMWKKFDLENAPTYTRLTTTSPMDTNQLYWLIFSYSKGVQAFSILPNTKEVQPVESIGDIFPVLDIGGLPGSAIRSYCWIANGYRLSVVGYDTGYVIASVCTMSSGTIVDRKTLKFSGPISVLRLINENEKDMITSVLISSTLGPAVIWSLKLEDDSLIWEMNTALIDSEIYDTVICCTVSSEYIFIGTYGEQLLVYSLEEAIRCNEVPPLLILNIASPILSIACLQESNTLIVLSNKGLHRFEARPHPALFSVSSVGQASDIIQS